MLGCKRFGPEFRARCGPLGGLHRGDAFRVPSRFGPRKRSWNVQWVLFGGLAGCRNLPDRQIDLTAFEEFLATGTLLRLAARDEIRDHQSVPLDAILESDPVPTLDPLEGGG